MGGRPLKSVTEDNERLAVGARDGLNVGAARPFPVTSSDTVLEPLDVPAWTNAIHRLLTEPAMAARLREAGLARARQYSWARTAKFMPSLWMGRAG